MLIIFINVLFPAPLGPIIETMSPFFMSNFFMERDVNDIVPIKSYSNKKDHGDIDIIVYKSKTADCQDILNIIKSALKITECKKVFKTIVKTTINK